jgi:transaldolase
LDDIARAADLLRPVYGSLDGSDGYVSVDVGPRLAGATNGVVEQARRFFNKLDRPNVMVKISATAAGVDITTTLLEARSAPRSETYSASLRTASVADNVAALEDRKKTR